MLKLNNCRSMNVIYIGINFIQNMMICIVNSININLLPLTRKTRKQNKNTKIKKKLKINTLIQ